MIGALTVLLCYQLVGEIVVRTLGLPVPGPVLGMLLLFATLLLRGSAPARLRTTAEGLLANLALLFVPAGVGVIVYIDLIRREWLAIAGVLLGSTLLTVAVSGIALLGLQRLALRVRGRKEEA